MTLFTIIITVALVVILTTLVVASFAFRKIVKSDFFKEVSAETLRKIQDSDELRSSLNSFKDDK